MNQVSVALKFLQGVRLHSPTATIAGGCARDLFHGRVPKDFDIVVPLGTNLFTLKNHIRAVAEEGSYRAFVFGERGPDGVGYSEDDRVIMCIKATFDGVAFDVLLYNVNGHALEALEHFDANLNQFFLDDTGTPYYGGNRHHHPKNGLKWVRDDANAKRKEYIQAKHQALYPELYKETAQ